MAEGLSRSIPSPRTIHATTRLCVPRCNLSWASQGRIGAVGGREKGICTIPGAPQRGRRIATNGARTQIHEHAHRISHVAVNRLENRRVVVLEQGFIGVTSAAARQGDLCAFINGLCCPVILRPVSDHPDHYLLVGNAYVLRGTRVVDGVVSPLRMDMDHKNRIEEQLPVRNLFLM